VTDDWHILTAINPLLPLTVWLSGVHSVAAVWWWLCIVWWPT